MPVSLCEWRVRIGRFIQRPPVIDKQDLLKRFRERWEAKKKLGRTSQKDKSFAQASTGCDLLANLVSSLVHTSPGLVSKLVRLRLAPLKLLRDAYVGCTAGSASSVFCSRVSAGSHVKVSSNQGADGAAGCSLLANLVSSLVHTSTGLVSSLVRVRLAPLKLLGDAYVGCTTGSASSVFCNQVSGGSHMKVMKSPYQGADGASGCGLLANLVSSLVHTSPGLISSLVRVRLVPLKLLRDAYAGCTTGRAPSVFCTPVSAGSHMQVMKSPYQSTDGASGCGPLAKRVSSLVHASPGLVSSLVRVRLAPLKLLRYAYVGCKMGSVSSVLCSQVSAGSHVKQSLYQGANGASGCCLLANLVSSLVHTSPGLVSSLVRVRLAPLQLLRDAYVGCTAGRASSFFRQHGDQHVSAGDHGRNLRLKHAAPRMSLFTHQGLNGYRARAAYAMGGFYQLYLPVILLRRAGDVEENPGPKGQESIVSEEEFLDLAKRIDHSFYIDVGIHLGFKYHELNDILREKQLKNKEALMDIFIKWRNRQLEGTNIRTCLAECLRKSDLDAFADKLCLTDIADSSRMHCGSVISPLTPEQVEQCKKDFQFIYRTTLCKIKSDPLNPDSLVEFEEMYTNLVLLEEHGRGKRSLEYDDLLDLKVNGKLPRRLIVQGEAGAGKTTLCAKIAWDWIIGKHYQEFDWILIVPLREADERAIGNIAKSYLCKNNLVQPWQLTRYMRSNPENIFIIFDGLDEFKGNLSQGSRETPHPRQQSTISQHQRCYTLHQRSSIPQQAASSRPQATTDRRRHTREQCDDFPPQRDFSPQQRSSIPQQAASSRPQATTDRRKHTWQQCDDFPPQRGFSPQQTASSRPQATTDRRRHTRQQCDDIPPQRGFLPQQISDTFDQGSFNSYQINHTALHIGNTQQYFGNANPQHREYSQRQNTQDQQHIGYSHQPIKYASYTPTQIGHTGQQTGNTRQESSSSDPYQCGNLPPELGYNQHQIANTEQHRDQIPQLIDKEHLQQSGSTEQHPGSAPQPICYEQQGSHAEQQGVHIPSQIGYNQQQVTCSSQQTDALSTTIVDIPDVLCSKQLEKCLVLVTTRPWKADEIRWNSGLRKLYTFIRVEGFNKENLSAYILKYFVNDKPKANQLIEFMQENDVLSEILPYPIYAAMICLMWRELEEEKRDIIKSLRTFSQVFKEMILFLKEHYAQKKIKMLGNMSLNEHLIRINEQLKPIGQLALQGLLKNILVFREEEFRGCQESLDTACRVGVLSQEARVAPRKDMHDPNKPRLLSTLFFPHKLFQEYLAGDYLASMYNDDRDNYLRLMRDNVIPEHQQFRYLLYFISAQNVNVGINVVTMMNTLSHNIRDFIIDVAFESQSQEVIAVAKNTSLAHVNSMVVIAGMTSHSIAGYLFTSLDLTYLKVSDRRCGRMVSRDLAESICSTPSLQRIKIVGSVFHDDFFRILAERGKESSVKHMSLSEMQITSEAASRDLASYLCSMPHLAVLHLDDITDFYDVFYSTMRSLASSSKVQNMKLYGMRITSEAASGDLAACLCSMPHLTRLTMWGENNVHDVFYSTLRSLASSSKDIFPQISKGSFEFNGVQQQSVQAFIQSLMAWAPRHGWISDCWQQPPLVPHVEGIHHDNSDPIQQIISLQSPGRTPAASSLQDVSGQFEYIAHTLPATGNTAQSLTCTHVGERSNEVDTENEYHSNTICPPLDLCTRRENTPSSYEQIDTALWKPSSPLQSSQSYPLDLRVKRTNCPGTSEAIGISRDSSIRSASLLASPSYQYRPTVPQHYQSQPGSSQPGTVQWRFPSVGSRAPCTRSVAPENAPEVPVKRQRKDHPEDN